MKRLWKKIECCSFLPARMPPPFKALTGEKKGINEEQYLDSVP